jgi:hypothetical protein
MRDKHNCRFCGEPFSRRWNMERYIIRKHNAPPGPSSIFPNSSKGRQVRYNAQRSDYHHPFPDLEDSNKASSWPPSSVLEASEPNCPSWIRRLRRWAEVSKLTAEIKQNRVLQSAADPLKTSDNKIMTQEPHFRYEDLVVVGYKAFRCSKCLICHPLTLYRHKSSMILIPTNHVCDTKTIMEVQRQKGNKKDVITTISNELPKLMFQVVTRWTNGTPLVQVDEIRSIPEFLHYCILVDSKNWALRAVQYGSTLLSDEELADFLNLAGGNTDGIFRTIKSNKTYYMRIVVPDTPKAQICTNFEFGN